MQAIIDKLGRPLRDLRISVTDRCNFRCVYCMPKEVFGPNHQFLPRKELLSFEEIKRTVHAFAALGVEKIRFTGGEPLVRRDLEQLISLVAQTPGIKDLSLTTNASLITQARAQSLLDAGLKRINVSLDALDDETFMRANDVGVPVSKVLEGIEAATRAGMRGTKVNMVVKRGVNEHSILPMARHFQNSGVILRFIEFMDVGTVNGWNADEVVSAKEIRDQIHAQMPLESVEPNYPGEVAQRYRYLDGSGEIGIIASVTQPFCGDCHRARLSAIGQLYTCLFGSSGEDLRCLLRDPNIDDTQLRQQIGDLWQQRADRYSEVRFHPNNSIKRSKVEMSYIGG